MPFVRRRAGFPPGLPFPPDAAPQKAHNPDCTALLRRGGCGMIKAKFRRGAGRGKRMWGKMGNRIAERLLVQLRRWRRILGLAVLAAGLGVLCSTTASWR